MAAPCLSTTNSFLSTTPPSYSTSSSSSPPTTKILLFAEGYDAKRQLNLCKALRESRQPPPVSTRRSVSICFITSCAFSLASRGHSSANAAVLEADDDEELLERVKKDRKKRLERQGVISSSTKETGYLQDLVYKLSKVGQAIENNDLSAAGSVLGGSTDTDWVQKANVAFTKLSSSPEEKTEVDTFNSSLASLISSDVSPVADYHIYYIVSIVLLYYTMTAASYKPAISAATSYAKPMTV